MKTKHTPGPWTVQRYSNYNGFSIWAPNIGCVAERWCPSEDTETPFEANARLIAAAPDLLNSLQELMAWLKSGTALENGAKCETKTEALDQAEQAIYKALGNAD